MAPYGYHPIITTPGLCTHDFHTINFILAFDGLVVNNYVKEHALYLKSSLEAKYKFTTDWDEKLYAGISFYWNYDKGVAKNIHKRIFLCITLFI